MPSTRSNHRCPSAQRTLLLAAAFLTLTASASGAADQLPLGTAANFAILGGPSATCTSSSISGSIGTGLPNSAIVQTSCPATGAGHKGDATAVQAYQDFLRASIATGNIACPTDLAHNLSGTLAGVRLAPGVYCFAAAAALTGTLTLDGHGDPNASWTFKVAGAPAIAAALTATNFTVVMANGAVPCNVNWWVNAGATFTSSKMAGNVLAGAGITFTGAGSFAGRALAKGAVTVSGMSSFGSCG